MCGIAGIFGQNSHGPIDVLCKNMIAPLYHRGPNEEGVWIDENDYLALGHTRLSILDLSPAGRQPMVSLSERYVIVFNGEIYNHLELRQTLFEQGQKSINWRGHSDTETLLACIEFWGLKETLKQSVGMFALALWDKQKRSLSLARDRIGEKPLYYGWQKNSFLFASELKAIKKHPSFENKINRDAIALQMQKNTIPAPYSIYLGLQKLIPGSILTLPLNQEQFIKKELPLPEPFWSLDEISKQGLSKPFNGNDAQAISKLEELLASSVRQQMVSDVPVGAFLSGGIDSSTIVALMQSQSAKPVKTFSIGFHEQGFNEAEYSKVVADKLGTNHTELYVSSKEAMEVIPQLPEIYDEPFSDSSQIPTYLVSKMAKEHVTVSLSGDAGDEIFAGYNRYLLSRHLSQNIPDSIRSTLSYGLTCLSPNTINSIIESLSKVFPRTLQISQPGDKAHKLAECIAERTPKDIYQSLISHWKRPSEIVIGTGKATAEISDRAIWPNFSDLEHSMMYQDALNYLPDDILVKVDRAAMSVSLETRVPMLDHRIIEFAWTLPLHMKIRDGESKWILRQVLYKYLPKEIFERPKMGFGLPIDSWLRGPLKEWAEDLLDNSVLQRQGYLNPEPIQQKWKEHLSGNRNWQYHLWDVLMFQSWLEKNQ